MATETETSLDLRRLASDRDWHGYLTLENLEAVAGRMRKLLTGRSYTWVACNSGLRHYFPEVRAGQQLRDDGVTTYRNDNGGRYSAGITVPDTYGVWGLHTDVPDQPTARKRRSEAWDEASEEQRRTDTWDDRDLTYLHIIRDKIEIEHFAIIGYRLYWVVTVEPRDDEGDALVIAALDEAAGDRENRAGTTCTNCTYMGDGPCPDQREHLERAAEYRAERDRREAGR
jgi:hypothetical protein